MKAVRKAVATSSTSSHSSTSWKLLWETLVQPCLRARAPGAQGENHYLEGLELALHLLREALTVLSKLPLLGGLSDCVLKPSFQLRKSRSPFYKTEQNLPQGPLWSRPREVSI